MKQVALIDGDSIAYLVANRAVIGPVGTSGFESSEGDFEGEPTKSSSIVICQYKGADVQVDTSILREEIQSLLNSIMKYTQTDSYEIWLSASSKIKALFERKYNRPFEPNFRFAVAEGLTVGYKHNRRSELLPGVLASLEILVDTFNANIADGWEADDEVSFLKNESPNHYVLAAMDKDVLGQCPGTHYSYKAAELVHTSPKEANFMKYWQCIVGDPADGYKGVPRIGPKGAEKFINEDMTDVELWNGTLEAYASRGVHSSQAVLTMRLASMHQLTRVNGIIVLNLFDPDDIVAD